MESSPAWARCSTCKGDIDFEEAYYVCSVSTCKRKGSDFRFCSVECWDSHVPTMRHREAWAEEATAPSRAEWQRENPPPKPAAPAPPQTHAPRPASPAAPRSMTPGEPIIPPPLAPAPPPEILIVVSKLKAYVRARSGMNTSDSVMDVLSDRVRELCDGAIDHAARDGRKTVMDRDF